MHLPSEAIQQGIKIMGQISHEDYLKIWKISGEGIETPIDEHNKIIVWLPDKTISLHDTNDDIPVIATRVPADATELDPQKPIWFGGVLPYILRIELAEPDLTDLAIDSALHGPTKLVDAVRELQEKVPIEYLDNGED